MAYEMRALYRVSPLIMLLFLSIAAFLIEMARAAMCPNDKTSDKTCDELFSAAAFIVCVLGVGVCGMAVLAPHIFESGRGRLSPVQ